MLEASLTIPPDEGYLILMPYYEMGTLNDYMKKNAPLSMSTRLDMLNQVLDVVVKCHSIGLYHRDLKLENFCVSEESGHVKVWLNDFGLATHEAFSKTRGCGSLGYMPPEAVHSIKNKRHAVMMDASKQDTWSLAMLVVNILFMVCTWRVADNSDHLYALYQEYRETYLIMTLPITEKVNRVLLGAFDPNWQMRTSVAEFVYGMKQAIKCGIECDRSEFLKRSRDFKGIMERQVPGRTAYPSPAATIE
jgi:serine/threonine protein kinase